VYVAKYLQCTLVKRKDNSKNNPSQKTKMENQLKSKGNMVSPNSHCKENKNGKPVKIQREHGQP
jgi:hypothetical protein